MLRELLGDGDRAAVLERLETSAEAKVERYRELTAIVNGRAYRPGHVEEFAWVIAALRAELGR
ncbi:hypothetical protein STSP_04360 [Streptomyces jeddahensis]|uniref:Uncharacterized protein n=1 Tax=Streptomyces jeddahensis TaxID=1716141 RepID=A0A177I0T5_9ACTN|nr:hypothetical protein STSP_04360 [Streptomyces jeddahensis]